MTLQVRNVNNIAVGTSTPTTPSAAKYPGSLADGEVGIFTEEGLHIRATAVVGASAAAAHAAGRGAQDHHA